MRLHKILAQSTELSRRNAEKVIAAGEVFVNGKAVTKMGVLVDPARDRIGWNGKIISLPETNIYVIYNKPKETLVTKKDSGGRSIIWDDLKRFKDKVNAVGRLDYDSEGLLILTNDGELINRLTHPKHDIKKIYNVKVKGFPLEEKLDKLRKGMTFEGEEYRPAEISFTRKTENNTWFEVKISEGKNRQIRNMFVAINHPVLKLKRFAVGPVRLGRMEPGEWRFLKPKERQLLLAEVGLAPKPKPRPRREFQGKRRSR